MRLVPRRGLRRAGVVLAALTTTVVAVPSATTAQPPNPSGWTSVPGPGVTGPNGLIDVKAFGVASAWAVGSEGNVDNPGTGLPVRPLTAHWNGRTWSKVATPDIPGTILTGVSGTIGNDVWAVGGSQTDPFGPGTKSVILHWDGVAWTEVPHVAATEEDPLALGDVAAVSRNDVWAVGFRGLLDGSVPTTPHAQRWNGTRWSEVKLPDLPGAFLAVVTSVSAAGSNNVYAAGFGFGEEGFIPYFAHWNGAVWTLLEPPPGAIVGAYNDIEALGGGDFVAVGSNASPESPLPQPVIASRIGGVWQQEAVPVPAAELNGLTVNGDGTLRAVGDLVGESGEHTDRKPLLLFRPRTGGWLSMPPPLTGAGGLREIDSIPGDNLNWAVGSTGFEAQQRSLILHGPSRTTG